jgi:MurNAc alpha-1-phosphate uridylyltransferase
MILAAGFGERMRPLTEHTPKPLLTVGGVSLIEHHIRRLAVAGFTDLVINVSHLGQQIIDFCGDGSSWGVGITFSAEDEPLETAGGIIKALPLLGNEPFLVVNGDVWTDYPFEQLLGRELPEVGGAHLVLVDNPPQHPLGDFGLEGDRVRQLPEGQSGFTFSGIGLYTPTFFDGVPAGKSPLRPLLDRCIAANKLTGEHYAGEWRDIGTPERLEALNAAVNRAT